MTDSITSELKPFHKLVANKLMAEVRSNSAQPTLVNVEGENTDAKTNNQRLVFPNALHKISMSIFGHWEIHTHGFAEELLIDFVSSALGDMCGEVSTRSRSACSGPPLRSLVLLNDVSSEAKPCPTQTGVSCPTQTGVSRLTRLGEPCLSEHDPPSRRLHHWKHHQWNFMIAHFQIHNDRFPAG